MLLHLFNLCALVFSRAIDKSKFLKVYPSMKTHHAHKSIRLVVPRDVRHFCCKLKERVYVVDLHP